MEPLVDPEPNCGSVSTPTGLGAEELFRAFADDVYRYVRRRVDANDAEDITAEVFATACRRITEVPLGAELPWLYRTAWNHVSNHWRKRTPLVVEQVQETADEFDDFADLVTESAALREAWASLSARDREVLRLVAWEGLDGAGLAAALGIGVSGAGAALWRARQHLRAAYDIAGSDARGAVVERQGAGSERQEHAQELPPPRHRGSGGTAETDAAERQNADADRQGGDR